LTKNKKYLKRKKMETENLKIDKKKFEKVKNILKGDFQFIKSHPALAEILKIAAAYFSPDDFGTFFQKYFAMSAAQPFLFFDTKKKFASFSKILPPVLLNSIGLVLATNPEMLKTAANFSADQIEYLQNYFSSGKTEKSKIMEFLNLLQTNFCFAFSGICEKTENLKFGGIIAFLKIIEFSVRKKIAANLKTTKKIGEITGIAAIAKNEKADEK